MNLKHFTTQIAHNAETIRTLIEGISDEQAGFQPAPDAWSILEVINHLYDEEREDFPFRLKWILERTDEPWPSIDPEGWATERQYNQRELQPSLQNFLSARQASLVWLKSLSSPNWQALYEAPFGQISAGDMFASWVAHDLLHIRQLVELHWATRLLLPYKVDYAGGW
jgi:hypothetical protein